MPVEMEAPKPGSVDDLKARGNAAFAAARYDEAIDLYSRALDGAPTSHVLYSNRAAAYLARRLPGDALNAISDANHAIRLDESFAKAYHRKGCALIQIGEYEDAMVTCQRGIRADPSNAALREALSQAQAGLASARMREAVEMQAAAALAREGPAEKAPSASSTGHADDDPLAAFYESLEAKPDAASGEGPSDGLDGANPFAAEAGEDAGGGDGDSDSEAEQGGGGGRGASTASGPGAAAAGGAVPAPATSSDAEAGLAAAAAARAEVSARIAAQPLGSGSAQLDRLLQRNHAWINLNPYEVLMLPPEASEEDVKARFRKLSALVHPDKHAGEEDRANEAFQAVKLAAETLQDHARRVVAAATVEAATREARRARRRLLKGGTPEAALPPWEEALRAETRKAFAEKEHRRRNYERRMKAETLREAQEEVAEHEAMLAQHKHEQEWAKGRDARMGSWVNFAGKRKRVVGDGAEGPTVLSDAMRFGRGGGPAGRAASGGAGAAPEKDYKKRWR